MVGKQSCFVVVVVVILFLILFLIHDLCTIYFSSYHVLGRTWFQKVITILCGESSNLGAVRSTAIPLLKQVLEPLGTTLLNSLKPDWQEEEETPFPATATYYQ